MVNFYAIYFSLKVTSQDFSNLCGYVGRASYGSQRPVDFGQPTSQSHAEVPFENELIILVSFP